MLPEILSIQYELAFLKGGLLWGYCLCLGKDRESDTKEIAEVVSNRKRKTHNISEDNSDFEEDFDSLKLAMEVLNCKIESFHATAIKVLEE